MVLHQRERGRQRFLRKEIRHQHGERAVGGNPGRTAVGDRGKSASVLVSRFRLQQQADRSHAHDRAATLAVIATPAITGVALECLNAGHAGRALPEQLLFPNEPPCVFSQRR